MSISLRAQELHNKMITEFPDKLFGQSELSDIIQIHDVKELLAIAQELVDNKLIKLFKNGDELKFQALTTSEANKIISMSDDEAMIYSYIEASGREGIWTKTIKAKTNLHQHVVMRCLKALESQRYIKSIKSVKHPTRKIYMLYNLQPSIDVTGGPWFTDSELDSEFIDLLTTAIWKYVAETTFPAVFKQQAFNMNNLQASYPYNYTGYVDINNISEYISSINIATIPLAHNEIRALCDVLVYEDKLENIASTDKYKATWQSILDGGFGKNYSQLDADSQMMLDQQNFSIFNNRNDNVIDEEEEDVVYFDAWIRS